MKKTIVFCLLICVILAVGCGGNSAPNKEAAKTPDSSASSDASSPKTNGDGEVFEIKEKMFIAQCNDIYLNPDDYMNKTIKLEGMYDEYTDPETGKTYRYVIRNGPGCCGNDGVAGFEFLYDGPPPQLNDWIEVIGAVEMNKEDDFEYVVLRLSQLTVLEERGAEFVTN